MHLPTLLPLALTFLLPPPTAAQLSPVEGWYLIPYRTSQCASSGCGIGGTSQKSCSTDFGALGPGDRILSVNGMPSGACNIALFSSADCGGGSLAFEFAEAGCYTVEREAVVAFEVPCFG